MPRAERCCGYAAARLFHVKDLPFPCGDKVVQQAGLGPGTFGCRGPGIWEKKAPSALHLSRSDKTRQLGGNYCTFLSVHFSGNYSASW